MRPRDDKCSRFEAMANAGRDFLNSEQMLKEAQERVKQCQEALVEARRHLDSIRPKRTFLDEWRAQRDATLFGL